jgi:bacillopeptidase F (M6 metalloprotease family)
VQINVEEFVHVHEIWTSGNWSAASKGMHPPSFSQVNEQTAKIYRATFPYIALDGDA